MTAMSRGAHFPRSKPAQAATTDRASPTFFKETSRGRVAGFLQVDNQAQVKQICSRQTAVRFRALLSINAASQVRVSSGERPTDWGV